MTVLVAAYFVCAVLLTLYGVNCHVMVHLFKRHTHQMAADHRKLLHSFYGGPPPVADPDSADTLLPHVTTQLPIYNEINVAERLIDAVCAMKYPHGKHEIQVLDDSTDETRDVVARKVAALRNRGADIKHLVRRHRRGFKAGALRDGLQTAEGEYVAIFDADFVPPVDFLLRAMPHFVISPNLGFVQGRWGHLNRNQSLITRLQAIGINGHFMVEQSARNTSGLFMNFNGTAGVFRKCAIIDAGNWQADTLTEDMDLSYRIQLSGWDCRYLADLVAPAEIPGNIIAFKNQQFRWAKGSIQTAIKLLPRIMRCQAPAFTKVQAFMHLTHYLIHPLMLFLSVMALPVLVSGQPVLPTVGFLVFGLLLLLSCTGPSRLYLAAEGELQRPRGKTLMALPLMVCFGCGLALSNTKAVFEAASGRRGRFIRTPKTGFAAAKGYRLDKTRLHLFEMLIGLWCLIGTAVYFHAKIYIVGHFLLLYAGGYFLIGLLTWRHTRWDK